METANEQEIFVAAAEIDDPEQRRAMLNRACAGDAELRARVEELLNNLTEAGNFFSECLTAVSTMVTSDLSGAASPATSHVEVILGSTIGPYKVLEVIGEGGCGVVYRAEQEVPVRRRVALKIIKLGMDTKKVIARFRAEQQALALMDHPNIARVLDAGATDQGRPFFVMELVPGIKLTSYCDQNQLDVHQRLHLFIQVCHAVQHAHQKSIIHRDLKPSNILVSMIDGVPVPKVIDFGIAKAIAGRLTDQTSFTSHHQFIGTPAYMSPEQAQMSAMDVDTRSDIYSLGVLLYELLTGRTPFDTGKLLQSGLDELQRTLRECDPQRPSAVLTAMMAEKQAEIARFRHADQTKLLALLRSDLDWIVIKALEKDRDRRYQTANGLAMDVQRYLDNEPVLARAPSRIYRFRKLVRRNKVVFTATGVVILAMMASSALATWFLLTAREAQRKVVVVEKQKTQLQGEAQLMREAVENNQKILRVAALVRQGQLQQADDLLNEVQNPKLDLEYADIYRTLGDWDVANNRWRKAIDRFGVLFRINDAERMDTSLDDVRYAATLVDQGYHQDYDRFRELLIARNAGKTDPGGAQRLVRECLLEQVNNDLLHALGNFADVAEASLDTAPTKQPPPHMAAYYCYSLALYAYRREDWAATINWCQRAEKFNQGIQSRDVSIQLIKAMALAKSGELQAAQANFDAGRKIVEAHFGPQPPSSSKWDGFWFDWICARIHLREATAVLADEAAGKNASQNVSGTGTAQPELPTSTNPQE